MRRLTALALICALLALPGLASAAIDVTIGLLPKVTASEQLVVRGVAPAGEIVVITVNGTEVKRVIAGPAMNTYNVQVPIVPGDNRIVAAVSAGGDSSSATASVFRTTVSFADMKEHWARTEAEILGTLGVVNGTGNGRFEPDLQLTRAQFAKIIVAGLGLQVEGNPELSFSDADQIPGWAHGYVAAAVKAGLIRGYEDGSFKPSSPVSRLEMAVIISRGLRLKGITEAVETAFADSDQIPAWAKGDVALATTAKVITGYSDNSFRPAKIASRAEAAVMIRRLMLAEKP